MTVAASGSSCVVKIYNEWVLIINKVCEYLGLLVVSTITLRMRLLLLSAMYTLSRIVIMKCYFDVFSLLCSEVT